MSHQETLGKHLAFQVGFAVIKQNLLVQAIIKKYFVKLSLINQHHNSPEGIQVDIRLRMKCNWINELCELECRKIV